VTADLARVQLDFTRDRLVDELSLATLRDQHLSPHETSPQQAFARAAAAFADDDEHAQRLYDYASQQWFMFSTPVLSNGGTNRGLPISCFLNYVADSRESILESYSETGWLSSAGGGVGTYWGAIRSSNELTSKGSASSGVIPFAKVEDSIVMSFSQGVTRRGAAAVYLDVGHPEIVEWINMRRPSGGDPNRKTLNLNNGVCVPDAFMRCVRDDQPWRLIDPHSREIKETVSARDLWRQILTARVETGEPYLFFVDAANRGLPEPLKKLGLRIHASNLCTEIMLPTSEERTAVCCLSSVNLARWDEWCEDGRFVEDLYRMLDNVLTFYVGHAPPSHARAVYSATRERSVGLGAMGFHSYLQTHGWAFGSAEAVAFNGLAFRYLRERADLASLTLSVERGEAPDLVGTGERFAHKLALAPNATSALVCGNVSPSIEPRNANAYLQKTIGGTFLVKSPELRAKLVELGHDDEDVWRSIATNDGSVQHLDFLDQHTRSVFLTAIEIDQGDVVRLAAERQSYVDQGQSVNVFVRPDVSARDLHRLHFSAWESGLKALYYCRSQAMKRATVDGLASERVVLGAPVLPDADSTVCAVDCVACEG
jgi:ribonucleoside-diphosphate reductase alpha chain